MEAILEIRDLVLEKDGKRIIDGLSMDVWKGHIHAVVGPNGAGKSSLSYVLMGLDGYTDYQGEIKYLGESLKNLSITDRAKKGLTLAWQEPARYEGLTVRQYLEASCKDENNKDCISSSLEKVGLEPEKYLDRALDKTLSGGERKRIELASIFIMKPELVIMDEPDSGIDIEAIENIFSMLKTFKDEGTTVIFITHSLPVLEKADHAFLLCEGYLRDKGKIGEIYKYFSNKCISCKHPNKPSAGDLNG
jgi:Fe-S cluster assembly ATP-binding protein